MPSYGRACVKVIKMLRITRKTWCAIVKALQILEKLLGYTCSYQWQQWKCPRALTWYPSVRNKGATSLVSLCHATDNLMSSRLLPSSDRPTVFITEKTWHVITQDLPLSLLTHKLSGNKTPWSRGSWPTALVVNDTKTNFLITFLIIKTSRSLS